MNIISRFTRILRNIFWPLGTKINAIEAYDIWARTYDNETIKGNLTIFYNDILVQIILQRTQIFNKIICDIGAGTGNYYKTIMSFQPKKYIACDSSAGMLQRLNFKFPKVETHLLTNNQLHFAKDNSIDFIFSSLMIGYVKDISGLLAEWNRVLKFNGEIIITLMHPDLSGLKNVRSFKDSEEKIYVIESYNHSIEKLRSLFTNLNWEIDFFGEESIDERSIPMLKKMNKMSIYQTLIGKRIICGFVVKK